MNAGKSGAGLILKAYGPLLFTSRVSIHLTLLVALPFSRASTTIYNYLHCLQVNPSIVFAVPPTTVLTNVSRVYTQCVATAAAIREDAFNTPKPDELSAHISLSKTLLLRPDEIDKIHEELSRALLTRSPFEVMLEGAQVFVNEDASRSFIGLLPTAGHSDLIMLLKTVDSVVASHRLPIFYDVSDSR